MNRSLQIASQEQVVLLQQVEWTDLTDTRNIAGARARCVGGLKGMSTDAPDRRSRKDACLTA
jgi:hypothetical protein